MIIGQRENGRHDAVTARAILRLSHGVSQLSAGNNPNSAHRGLRCRHPKKGRKYVEQCAPHINLKIESCISRNEQLHQRECSHDQAVGSKRKWRSDSCHRRRDTSMDAQDYTPNLYDKESRLLPGMLQTHPALPQWKDDTMMHTECTDRSSSSSSAATTRRSSSSSTNSPPITSSDEDQPKSARREVVEAVADDRKLLAAVSIVPRCSKGNSSRLQSCSSGGHSACRSKQAGRIRRPPNCPSSGGSNTTIAGDSSDGLSVKLKVSRLSSMPTTTLPSASASARRSRGKEGGTARKSRPYESHVVTTTAAGHSWPFHGAGKDDDLRHYTLLDGDKDERPVRQCSRHRLASGNSPCGRYTVPRREASPSRSPSSRTSSSDCLNAGYRTSDSGEDLANDEQSDFPADEWPPLSSRLTYRLLQPTPARVPAPRGPRVATNRGCGSQPPRGVVGLSSATAKHARGIRAAAELQKMVRAPVPVCLLASQALEPQQMDSELEAIIDNTWPMLSSRAKAAYLRGVSQAGLRRPPVRWHSSREAKQQLRDKGAATIQFVPSVLGSVTTSSVSAEKPAVTQSCSNIRRSMPTPPWELEDIEDDDESLGPSLQGQSSPEADSMQSEARRYSDSGHNPTVDNWTPTTLSCSPLSETNIGHRMLQRLGWKPGIGLGVRSQGILIPVGCSLASGLTCDQREAETR